MRMFARLMRKHCIISKHGSNDPNQMLRDEKFFTGSAGGGANAAANATNFKQADLTLSPLEFTAASMEVTRGSTQTTVASKVKMFQDTNADNEWVINVDWNAPTVPPADDYSTLKDTEKRTMRLVGLH